MNFSKQKKTTTRNLKTTKGKTNSKGRCKDRKSSIHKARKKVKREK